MVILSPYWGLIAHGNFDYLLLSKGEEVIVYLLAFHFLFFYLDRRKLNEK
jgi:hypothetical protein